MYKENRHIAGIDVEQKINKSLEIPDNYFSDLQNRLENIAEEQFYEPTQVIPIWLKVAVVSLTCCLSVWLLKSSNTTTNTELVSNQVNWEDYEEFLGIETEDLMFLEDFDETLTLLENEVFDTNN